MPECECGTMILSHSKHDTLPDCGSYAGEMVGQVQVEVGKWGGKTKRNKQ